MVEIVKNTVNPLSQQATDSELGQGGRTPHTPFEKYIDLFYSSFVVAGLTDKITTWINSWFNTGDKALAEVLNQIDHSFLNRNKVLTWNAFFEVIRNGKGQVVELIPVLSETILVLENGRGYVQTINEEEVFFNSFTPLEEQANQKAIYEAWPANGSYRLEPDENGEVWFNPALNEVFQFRNQALNDIYYGESYFKAVMEQLLLLASIDTYYTKGFNNWMIKTKIIYNKKDKNMPAKAKQVLSEFIRAKSKGLDNAFGVAVVDTELGQMDLEHDIDAKAFIEYRKQLLQSISLALNIPFDLVMSDNSNRSTSQVSLETFNKFTITPLQQENIKQLKYLFQDGYNIKDLEYVSVDVKDEKEEMQVMTWYANAWIITPNEVRKKLGLPPIEWGDELNVRQAPSMEDEATQEEIEKKALDIINKVENEFAQTYRKDFNWES